MKRLLAYLLIVLGLGLTFNVNSNGKEINKDIYKFKKILIPLSKDGSWKLIGKKSQSIYSAQLSFVYLAQTKDNQLSKLIELVHVSAANESVSESVSWFKNFLYQENGFNSCIPKSSNSQPLSLREKYYIYEASEKSNGCFFTRNMDIEKEILYPTVRRQTTFLDTNHFPRIVKKYINNEANFPKIMLRSDHYFSSQRELYGYFEMINPDVNGAPNTLFKSEKQSEYHPLNIDNYPQKKIFYLTWIKNQAKKHLKFETELKRKYKIDLAKYINYEPIKDLKDSSEITQIVEKKSETTLKKIAKAEPSLTQKTSNEKIVHFCDNRGNIYGQLGQGNYFIDALRACKDKLSEQKFVNLSLQLDENVKDDRFLKIRVDQLVSYYDSFNLDKSIIYNQLEKFNINHQNTQIAKNEKVIVPKKKIEVAKVEEPKQEEFKPKTKDIDNDAPIIEIAEAITVDSQAYTLKGKVNDKSQIYLTINGRQVDVKKGRFELDRFSIDPDVAEELKIVAIDQWNNKSEKIVKVTIDLKSADIAKVYEELKPNNIKVKTDQNKIAIIIGIEKYENLTNLDAKYANRDAKAFRAYAKRALGIKPSNIKMLIDDKAKRGNTLEAFKIWLPKIAGKGGKDIHIFFAGHGLASENGKDLYVLPQDGNAKLLDDTAITRLELISLIQKVNPKSVTMFFDTCYSGQTRDEKMLVASLLRPIQIITEEQDTPDNFTIFSASNYDQVSGGIEEAQHGMFSYFLMKGLEGNADENKDKTITNGELIAYLKDNVSQEAFTQNRQQDPMLAGDPDKVLMSYR